MLVKYAQQFIALLNLFEAIEIPASLLQFVFIVHKLNRQALLKYCRNS